MKRIVGIVILFAMLFIISGCGSSTPTVIIIPSSPTTPKTNNGSGVLYDEVLGSFRSAAKAGGFEESRYMTGELEETEEQYVHIVYIVTAIKEAYESLEESGVYWTPQSYDVSICYDKNNELTSLSIITRIESSYTDFHFAVLSLYLYEAVGFPEVEPDAFYEEYNLFFKEDTDIYKQINGWSVSSTKLSNSLHFSIWYTE